jgi:hypothetical protein
MESPMHQLRSFCFAHQVGRPSRSDYDGQARSANAIAEPQLWWGPLGKGPITLKD